MKKGRRENEAFSIAFLDVITCGFGAIILLLMVSRTGESPVLESSELVGEGVVRELQTQLFEIRGETRILNRELDAKHEQVSIWDDKVARLETEFSFVKRTHDAAQEENKVSSIISGKLELALQTLSQRRACGIRRS